MKNKLGGMVLGSFAGDALSLAAHWIYNTEKIKEMFGRIENIVDINTHTYHTTKKTGDFTHYGDQVMMLMNYLKAEQQYNNEAYKYYWLSKMETYNGYIDHATMESIKKVKKSKEVEGSSSSDVSGASMIAPLIHKNHVDIEQLMKDIEAFIKLTHNNETVVDVGKFMAGVTIDVINGMKPLHAINYELENNNYISDEGREFIKNSIIKVKTHLKEEGTNAITLLGQSCGIAQAFPSTMYLILKYEEDFENALIENVMAGGDSAARGLMVGMVLGAYKGKEGLPEQWLGDMNNYSKILRLLS